MSYENILWGDRIKSYEDNKATRQYFIKASGLVLAVLHMEKLCLLNNFKAIVNDL
jgi:hypothetical protein